MDCYTDPPVVVPEFPPVVVPEYLAEPLDCYVDPPGVLVDALVDMFRGKRVVEVCAGKGAWAAALGAAGLHVECSDCNHQPWSYVPIGRMVSSDHARSAGEGSVLLIIFPNNVDTSSSSALRAFGGSWVVFIGDPDFCGDPEFHANLASEWFALSVMELGQNAMTSRTQVMICHRRAPTSS